jgi:hypothetical protein
MLRFPLRSSSLNVHFLQSVDLRGRMCYHEQSLVRRAFSSRMTRHGSDVAYPKEDSILLRLIFGPFYENTVHGLNAIVLRVLLVPWSITNCSAAPIRMFCDVNSHVKES